MTMRGQGVGVANWLVSKTSGFLDARLSRRSFIARATLVGTAVAASGCAVVTRPGSPYTYITDCAGGALCRDGYTEFCCVINSGVNACPPNTIPAGWWRADGSPYCDSGTRYYIDCNEECCGPTRRDGFCAGCEPCRCAAGCDTRKVHCNYFRYGQCNQGAAVGPIACRMVSCVAPYDLNIGCDPSGAVDNATANHFTDCTPYAPPQPPAVEVSLGAAVGPVGTLVYLVVRGSDGSVAVRPYDKSASPPAWTPWQSLGGYVTSRVVAAQLDASSMLVTARGQSGGFDVNRFNGSWSGWTALNGAFWSDPAVVPVGTGGAIVIGRGSDRRFYENRFDGSSWSGWAQIPPGIFTSDPAAVSDGSGGAFLFGRGSNNEFFVNRFDGTSWTGWSQIPPGVFASDPVAAKDSAGHAWLFGRGTDSGFFANHYVGSQWAGWSGVGGVFTSDPCAVTDGASGLLLLGRGGDYAYYANHFDGSQWLGWSKLGGAFTSDPAAAPDGAGGVLVFGRGTQHDAWWTRFDGSAWSTWQSLGGIIESVRGADAP
jgi:hypothetical protein